MRFRTPHRIVPFSALALILLVAAACGGGGSSPSDDLDDGGGGGGGLVATFTGTPSAGNPGDVSMDAAASVGADFDVDVVIQGPLTNFFGLAFHVSPLANIDLLPGSSGSGSILHSDPQVGTEFLASQAGTGEAILVTATRVQGGAGFDNGVDVPAGQFHIMTLRFRATDATAGTMTLTNTELRRCGAITCDPEVPTPPFTGGDIVAN